MIRATVSAMNVFGLSAGPPADYDDPLALLRAMHRQVLTRTGVLERVAALLPEPTRAAEATAALPGLFAFFDDAWRLHCLDEDGSLFPRLHDLPELDALECEHRALEAIYLALRDVGTRLLAPQGHTDAVLVEAFASHTRALADGLAAHIACEERLIFPHADALPAPERRAIGLEMRLRRGGAPAPRG